MHATRCGCKAPCKEQAGNRELSSSPIFYNHRIVLRSARALMLRSRAARARSRNPHSSRELRGVSKHEGALGRSSSSFETRASAFALASPSRMRAPQDEDEHAFQSCSRCQTAHRVPRRDFCARAVHLCFANPIEGWRSAERRSGARRNTRVAWPLGVEDARERACDAGRPQAPSEAPGVP